MEGLKEEHESILEEGDCEAERHRHEGVLDAEAVLVGWEGEEWKREGEGEHTGRRIERNTR